ncbi:hypothetical protein CBW65_13140 [Tumebacillus avium]|uniref:DUF3906 domain-containing protein n=1 Tax=Tumebacillus avium TaxID=1903704 RepID=A0A1Y0INN8_9BACL|nr:DUF3906 family protein [Tumebacillus avium]ARU61870.1 hypothetical protein CBW65_13140 [Tumebacillus avium]
MFLYRLEAKGKGFPDSQLFVLAEDEEGAFASAEALLERSALGLITIDEFAIIEKKRAEKGSGYVVETTN